MKNSVLALLFVTAFSGLFSQNSSKNAGKNPRFVEGRIVLQLAEKADARAIERLLETAFRHQDGSGPDFAMDQISAPLSAWVVLFEPAFLKNEAVVAALFQLDGVRWAGSDFEVEYRDAPNDAQFFKQWDLQKIQAEAAWDASTGGVSSQGDTIVVAVLERGLHRDHPDLRENMWKNRLEIPANGIDDDQNGYVDDFAGWDARNDNDSEGDVKPHAASVCGIIGARGDNKIGVAGVNWKVKILPLMNSILFSEIVENYSYALVQRRLWNQTGGKKGAFIVATNASFGAPAVPSQAPLWCAIYDSLGREGVVSVGATTNEALDVDQSPDLPSQCQSEFLIVVTNTDIDDLKAQAAGFGEKNVDLGAPGDGTWTTDFRPGPSDTTFYNVFGGTSGATPHVAGAVAWLFSLDCPLIGEDARTAPAESARRARALILDNAEAIPSLQNITATGGRLNLYKILTAVRALCGGTIGNLEITKIWPSPAAEKIVFEYETPDFATYQLQINSADGKLMWSGTVKPEKFALKKMEITVAHFAAGTYTLTISNRARGKASKKFVKG